jgi:hypothetical protein
MKNWGAARSGRDYGGTLRLTGQNAQTNHNDPPSFSHRHWFPRTLGSARNDTRYGPIQSDTDTEGHWGVCRDDRKYQISCEVIQTASA